MGRDVIIACDFDSREKTFDFLEKFGGARPYLKIGMELYYAEGPDMIRAMKERALQMAFSSLSSCSNTSCSSMLTSTESPSRSVSIIDFISADAVLGNYTDC